MEGWILGDREQPPLTAGDSLHFLAKASLPADMAWAHDNPAITGAFARAATEIENIGAKTLPLEVRTLVLQNIFAWRGGPPSLRRKDIEARLSNLAGGAKAAARLALLTALATCKVDAHVIHEFRHHYPNDVDLLVTTAWASFAIARKIGLWVYPTSAQDMKA